jgi:hypothetical protein
MTPLTDYETAFVALKLEATLIAIIVADDCLTTGNNQDLRKEWIDYISGYFCHQLLL